MGDAEAAATDLADFVQEVPHSAEIAPVNEATARIAGTPKDERTVVAVAVWTTTAFVGSIRTNYVRTASYRPKSWVVKEIDTSLFVRSVESVHSQYRLKGR